MTTIVEKLEKYEEDVKRRMVELMEKGYEKYEKEIGELSQKWMVCINLRSVIKQNKVPRKSDLVVVYNEILAREG